MGQQPATDRQGATGERAPQPGGALAAVGVAACVWMVVFAGFHLYWALGGTLGLPAGERVVDNPPLLVIDLVAIPLNLVGAALALALVRPWGRRLPRWVLLWCGWGCAGLMIFHALPNMVDLARHLGGWRAEPLVGAERFSVLLYEPYWMLGGLLFAALTWGFQRRSAR